jgi:hypothetical protein
LNLLKLIWNIQYNLATFLILGIHYGCHLLEIIHISYVSFHCYRHPDLSALGYKNDIKKRMYISFWVWWNSIQVTSFIYLPETRCTWKQVFKHGTIESVDVLVIKCAA